MRVMNAPSLAQVFDRKIGSTNYSAYSLSMSSDDRTWTASNLRRYLDDPNGFIKGTNMPAPNLDKATIDVVVSVLKGLATDPVVPDKYGEN